MNEFLALLNYAAQNLSNEDWYEMRNHTDAALLDSPKAWDMQYAMAYMREFLAQD